LNIAILVFVSAFSVLGQELAYPQADLLAGSSQDSSVKRVVSGDEISPGKAALLSLIIPGAGEYYAGKSNFLAFFLTTEIIAWSSLIANNLYYKHLVNEYKIFAVQHAGFAPGVARDDRFWTDIGKYDDIFAFNARRERERYFEDLYPVTPETRWRWDGKDNRLKYDAKRLHANDIDNRRVYFQLAVVLNHLISGINAIRIARKHNKQLKTPKVGFRIDAYRQNDWSGYIGFNLKLRF